MMEQEIQDHLNDPKQLEKMYRKNKAHFKKEFSSVYPAIQGNVIADCWNERLNYESDEINWGSGKDLILLIIACLTAGIIAKFPAIFKIDEELFYSRNIGFIVFPLLTAYFSWKNGLKLGKIALFVVITLVGLVFINLLPNNRSSDTLVLSCIHLVLVQWSVLGFAFVGTTSDAPAKRLGFLKYNGDLVVMTALILIAGGIMSGVTVGLFSLIGLNIEQFYFQNVAIFGLAAAPIVGTYLTQTNPQLVGKVSPVIAKLFSPLVVVMLIVYLIAIVYSGKNPYTDRDFLVIFNALLIGVMAIIFFSVAETARATTNKWQIWVLFLLAILTIIVNCVALSAILFRITEWGITPNRAAVLGGNVLILINLVFVTLQLFKVFSQKSDLANVGRAISAYLPIYFVWAAIVAFIFPFLFGFK
jgi:hypothetical protein